MQVGDLVKWNARNNDYGDLGIVVKVHPKATHWRMKLSNITFLFSRERVKTCGSVDGNFKFLMGKP